MYNMIVIRNFKDKDTEKIFNQVVTKKFPYSIQKRALIKLIMINNAKKLEELKSPPGNHLEKLSGDREGICSIRINDKFRICFRFEDGDFYDLEIVDYH